MMHVDASDAALIGVFVLITLTATWAVSRANRRAILNGQAQIRAELEAFHSEHKDRSEAWAVMNQLTTHLLESDAQVIPLARARRR